MPSTITFHNAGPADDDTLRRLAQLDSAAPLRGDVVIGIVDGWAVAAISLADDRVVADPFVHTADVVAMLRAHALTRMTGGSHRRRRQGVRRPAFAHH